MPDPLFSPSANLFLLAAQAGLIASVVGAVWFVVHARCRSLIDAWAGQGGWEVVAMRRCVIATGPFSLVPGLPVYRVEFASRSGRIRKAYVRCGSLLMSVLADEVAVEWADARAR